MSDTERDVAALMAKGLAPSEIDRALRLPEEPDSFACRCGGKLKKLRYFDDYGPTGSVVAAKEDSNRILAVCEECGAVYAVRPDLIRRTEEVCGR